MGKKKQNSNNMQLPSFIRDPAVTIIGEKCYGSLVENLNLGDTECIKYAISKAIGIAMILGGSIVKIPQILTIMRNQSTEGLSLVSYVLETFSYSITTSYNLRQNNPFSTFGEIMLILIQNVVITLLIFHFTGKQGIMAVFLLGLGSVLYCLNNSSIIPPVLMGSLFAATIPLNMASKIPQIYTNFKNKSTGQLSVFAVVNYFAGSSARVFTTMAELDDPVMLFGGLLASALNGILLLQVIMYWGNKTAKTKKE